MISQDIRRVIFDYLTLEKVCWHGRLNEVDFLERIYSLDDMPSSDPRQQFNTAKKDIHQHRIRNLDWDDNWVYNDERFGLMKGEDNVFLRFLCEMLHPIVREDPEEVSKLLVVFNDWLRKGGYNLVPQSEMSGRPLFKPVNITTLPRSSVQKNPSPAAINILPKSIGFSRDSEYEDGTNIAMGASYREEEFSPRMLPWYVPSETKGRSNWKSNLDRLRSRFDAFIDQHCATECLLTQTTIPQSREVALDVPGQNPQRKLLSSGPGLRKEPAKLFGLQQPLTALFPMKDVRGEPMLNPDGKPMPFRLGLSRVISVQAIPDGVRCLPIPKLSELLRDGRDILFQLPPEMSIYIWRNWPTGFPQRASSHLWLDALFELAWQREVGAPNYLQRFAWHHTFSVGLVGNGLFPRIPDSFTTIAMTVLPHEHGYPVAWYSKISDVARASIAAIDEIMELATVVTSSKSIVPLAPNPMHAKADNTANTAQRDRVFISYSHKDTKFLDQLLTHLKPLERTGQIAKWSDKQIASGSKWFDDIQSSLARAKAAVLLVTPDFLASDFIHEHELGPLLAEAAKGGVRILWIPVRASAYKETALNDYQSLCSPDKPLAQMKAERDAAWVEICREIKKAVKS